MLQSEINEYTALSSTNNLMNQHEQKSSNKKRGIIGGILISLLLLIVVSFIFLYLSSKTSSPIETNSNVLSSEKVSAPYYPSDEEIEEYRSKVVTIEYSKSDLPKPQSNPQLFDPSSDAMKNFHNELITKYGYNSQDYNIQFRIQKEEKEEEEDEEELTDDAMMRKKQSSTLNCTSVYSFSSLSGFLEVSCNSDEEITGCISYEPDTNGYRWGETGYYTSQCYTNGYSDDYTSISARCCSISGNDVLSTSYSSNYNGNSDTYCLYEECDEGDYAIGCTVSDSSDYTAGFGGTQRTKRDYLTYDLSGCKGQRSDSGYLWVAPYCASLSMGSLLCYTVEGTTSYDAVEDGYFSVVACDDEDYELTDCNAQVRYDIDGCTSSPTSIDWGVNYGGWMDSDYCAAKGSSNIQAQATCCKID